MVRELGSAAFPFSAPPFSGVRLDIISRVTRCVISSCAEDFGISADSYPVAMTNTLYIPKFPAFPRRFFNRRRTEDVLSHEMQSVNFAN